jgi:hypothetical protein
MLDSVRKSCQNYYDQIPAGSGQAVVKSALCNFVLHIVLTRTPGQAWDVQKPLVYAGLGALASCIYSLTAPIFNYAFEDDRILLHRESLKVFLVQAITTVIYVSTTAQKVNLTAVPFLLMLPLNFLKSGVESWFETMEFTLGLNPVLNNLRDELRVWGIGAAPGSASTVMFNGISGI